MINLRTLDELPDVEGKTVIVRSNLNVPMENGEITDNYRIQRSAITIRELMEKKARVVVISHLGRPEGAYEDQFSFMPIRFELGNLLDTHVKFAHPKNSRNSIIFMENGEVLLLENMRFEEGETSDDPEKRKELVAELAELGDFYVNDSFDLYREHASVSELAEAFDEPYAGRQMVKEIEMLSILNEERKSPYVAVIGGAKLDTKVPILEDLVTKADSILIGGAMAYTFLAAKGINVGKSKIDEDHLETAKTILAMAEENNCHIMLPVDHLAGEEFAEDTQVVKVDTQQIPDGLIGLDIGEQTMASYLEKIKSASTILWNGPMGVFEWNNFSRGTEAIGEYIALTASKDAFKVAGGGDTIAAMHQLKINFKNFAHVSTGGGSMLEFLSGTISKQLKLLEK